MKYKSKISNLLHTVIVDGKKLQLKFREGDYETEDKKIIEACDKYIEKASGDNLTPSPFFLSEEAFNKLHVPNELISVTTDRYGKIDVYVPVSYITELYKYFKSLK